MVEKKKGEEKKKTHSSVFKYEMQAPSSGHDWEMRTKALVAFSPGSSPGDPWSLSREMRMACICCLR